MKTVTVNKAMANQTIEKFLRKYLENVPLNTIYKLLRNKDVKANGKRINKDYIVQENDVLDIYIPDQISKPNEIQKTGKHFDVVYEDDQILVVNKQIGILSQQDKNHDISLSEEVLYYLYQKGEYQPETSQGFKPSPAHRLDRNTCGIVLFGKSVEALHSLSSMLKEREGLTKKYRALVFHYVEQDGEVNVSLKKDADSGKVYASSRNDKEALSARTAYHVLGYYQDSTLLDVTLFSGRTHQIRAHMAYIGFPLVGDSKYGDFALNKKFEKDYHFSNQFLQAYYIHFDKVQGPLSYLSGKTFTVPMESTYQELLKKIATF